MYCRKCGNEILEGQNFCRKCGTSVAREKSVETSKPDVKPKQGKNWKPLIIGVGSGILLLAIGVGVVFATGILNINRAKDTYVTAEDTYVTEGETTAKEEKKNKSEDTYVTEKRTTKKREMNVYEEVDDEDETLDAWMEEDKTMAEVGQDYLCSYSAERLLMQSDINALYSGVYSNLPEGKDIIQMVINEMYARRGYQFTNVEIGAYFEAKEWYRTIANKSNSQETIYQNMTDIEKKNIDFLRQVSAEMNSGN